MHHKVQSLGALDTIAEYELNCDIEKNAKDKTVVFIMHRLSTTMHVDKIHMMEKGRITENGSHDELINLNGKYPKCLIYKPRNISQQSNNALILSEN